MWSRRRGGTDATHASIVLAVDGMHCGSCGLTIDDAVEDVPGVARSTTSFRTGLTQVVLVDGADAGAVAPLVLRAVADTGYHADLRQDGS